jgi:hypothetical protein
MKQLGKLPDWKGNFTGLSALNFERLYRGDSVFHGEED